MTELDPPEPHRPLGMVGRALWERVWAARWIDRAADTEQALMVCESADERQALRVKVLSGAEPGGRHALRELDKIIMDGLGRLGCTPTDRAQLPGVGMGVQARLQARVAALPPLDGLPGRDG